MALLTAAACLGVTAFAAPAASAATPAEIDAAVARGADFLESRQMPNGVLGDPGNFDFGGDWALGSLAAAGRDVDAIRAAADAPSALGAYRTLWTGGPDDEEDWTTPSGPIDLPVRPSSDYSKALIVSQAAGLEPTRLAPNQNLAAQLAGLYHGRPVGGEDPDAGRIEGNFGRISAFDGAVSGLNALSRTAVPQVLLDTVADVIRSNQLDNGGWGWTRVTSAADRANDDNADLDMTGQAVSALCDAGVRPTDPAIVRALAYLKGAQMANGGLSGPWDATGNTNSTASLVFALNACGIDPESADWTTPDGNSPIDFLLARQLGSGPDAGGFGYTPEDTTGNFYATQEAVRSLTGSAFVAPPGERRPSPKVADGTVVPQALVIDAGIDPTGARDLRFCRVSAPVGATVAQLLETAATSAQPSGCVTGLSVQDGAVRALNGVAGDGAQRTWLARVEAGAPRRAGAQPVCHGQIVSLYVGRAVDAASSTPAPCTAAEPPVDPAPQPPSPAQPTTPAPPVAPTTPAGVAAPAPRVTVARRKGARSVRLDRKGRVRITLRCPASAGKRGCSSVVEARAKYRATPRGEARDRRVGGRAIRVSAGRSRTVTVTLSPVLRRDLRRVGTRSVRFVVRTQGDDPRKPSRSVLTVAVRPAARG